MLTKMKQVPQMSQLKIKDNTCKDKEEFHIIQGLTDKIAGKTLDELEKEGIFVFPELVQTTDDLSKGQIILQSYNNAYLTGNVMGFLGYGKEKLIIESRFSKGDKDYLFQYLLNKVIDIPNIFDMKSHSSHEDWLFNILAFMFPVYLKSALRKGVFKTYFRHEYNDSNVKGIIDIPRHISKNIPFVGNIAYSQREHTTDNYITELIRHTIEFIKRKSYGNLILAKAKDEVSLILSATSKYLERDRIKIISQNKKNIIRHAYYREYRALQRLCLMILQHQSHSVGFDSQQIYGVLFDGAWLWEEYINKLISERFYHPMNKTGKYQQKLFSDSNGKLKGLIYPDFISRDSNNRIIADAKYKPIKNIGNDDYLQLLAYMFRFDAKKGFYIYPDAENSNIVECFSLNSGSSFEKNVKPRHDILVVKLGLSIPDNMNSYADFEKEMVNREKRFVSQF